MSAGKYTGYAWLILRAVLRHAYGRVFDRCVRLGLNGPRHDPFDTAVQRWLFKHF